MLSGWSDALSFSVSSTFLSTSVTVVVSYFSVPRVFSVFSDSVSLFSLVLCFSLVVTVFLTSSHVFQLVYAVPSSHEGHYVSPVVGNATCMRGMGPLLSSGHYTTFIDPATPV